MSKELEVTIEAAKKAGEIVKKNFSQLNTTMLKEGGSFYTEIDQRSEEKIISIIKEKFPDHSFVAEESDPIEKDSDYTWMIDPLDGTSNYINHLPFFAVSIALIKQGDVQLGVVYDPIHSDLFTVEKGKRAKMNDYILEVSKTSEIQKFVIGYGRPHFVKEKFVEIFSKVELAARTPKILGSMALDMCYVASGRLDAAVAFSPRAWDVAAGVLLVEEAGGVVTDFAGKKWNPDSTDVLASNGIIHEQLLAITQKFIN